MHLGAAAASGHQPDPALSTDPSRRSGETQPDLVGDWNRLGELFAAKSFGVLAWDPPHITDAGHGLVGTADLVDRCGTHSAGIKAINICHTFAPFLRAARAVLDPRL